MIGIIFEARPNVTIDAGVLCLKTANATILRGGKEAFHTNQIIVSIMRNTLESLGINGDAIQLVRFLIEIWLAYYATTRIHRCYYSSWAGLDSFAVS